MLSESSRAGGPLGVAWCLRLLWRRRQRLCGGVPCAPSGELLLFRRSCLCRPLCAASGDLCLFLLSRGCRLLCAVCSSFGSRRCAVRVSVAVPLYRRRQLLAGALCRSCSADERHVWVRFTGIIGSPCGVPRSSTISDLWFLSCAGCGGFAAADLSSIGWQLRHL